MRAYTDDLAIAHSAHNKDTIIASLQPEADIMVASSAKARLTHNSSKCKMAFFSLYCAESAWQHNIAIDGKRMFYYPLLIFLGVRTAAHLWRTFPKALPVDVLHHLLPLGSGRYNLKMAHTGPSSGLHRTSV